MAEQWQFLFAVFLMYGFIFTIYTLSDGAIYGLDSASVFEPNTTNMDDLTFVDYVTSGIGTLIGFFIVLFIPINQYWWMTAINWAIIGTTAYMFLRMIRGGG